MVGMLDLIILIFMDYIFAVNLGINVKGLFLNSFAGFAINIFTAEFFTMIIGIVVLFVIYYFIFPILFPLVIYRIISFIYGFVMIFCIWLPTRIWNLIFRRKQIIIDLSILQELKMLRMIKEGDGGIILPDKRTMLLLEMYKDIEGEGKIEDFYVYLTKITLAIFVISLLFKCSDVLLILLGTASLVPLLFACSLFNLYLNRREIKEIIEKLKPNLPKDLLELTVINNKESK